MASSSSYKQFQRLRIPLEDIASATDNFSDANFIREGGFGKVYKGNFKQSGKLIDIVARRFDPKYGHGTKEFWMEVMMLSTLKHENLVSIIGFCDEDDVKIVVNKREAKGSLDQYLRDPITLTWTRRLEICVGMARALSYIHYEKKRNFSVVHRNIKSSKILLDENWKPKLSGFELSMKTTASQRGEVHRDRVGGTIGYIDPIYEETGSVSHKSDVYSFGVVLFEVMCGTTALMTSDQGIQAHLVNQVLLEEESVDAVGKLVERSASSPDVLEKLDQGSLDVEGKLDEGIPTDAAWELTDDERSSPPPISRPGWQNTHSLHLSVIHYYETNDAPSFSSDRSSEIGASINRGAFWMFTRAPSLGFKHRDFQTPEHESLAPLTIDSMILHAIF